MLPEDEEQAEEREPAEYICQVCFTTNGCDVYISYKSVSPEFTGAVLLCFQHCSFIIGRRIVEERDREVSIIFTLHKFSPQLLYIISA